jgi:glucose dehydrogenase
MSDNFHQSVNAGTAAPRWTWDPIPWAEKQLVRTGAANAWSTIASDPARDLIFIPTGSASPDCYGGARPGDNKWATRWWRSRFLIARVEPRLP